MTEEKLESTVKGTCQRCGTPIFKNVPMSWCRRCWLPLCVECAMQHTGLCPSCEDYIDMSPVGETVH